MVGSDSITLRISLTCPTNTQQILTAAWAHDVNALRKLLGVAEQASAQDPTTGETPLHAAIRACGPISDEDIPADLEAALETVRELFLWGAIWNDVDNNNETPGCVAWRLQRMKLYSLCVEAGVRAEMLFCLLDGYEKLSSEEGDQGSGCDMEVIDSDLRDGGDGEDTTKLSDVAERGGRDTREAQDNNEESNLASHTTGTNEEIQSEEYLRSTLTYFDGKLVDQAGNGIMMAWETNIMQESVDVLVPNREAGKRILNIGFGMGIVDSMFAETEPARHHIIEAHPGVLARIASGDSGFGSSWEASGPYTGAFKVIQGKWQDVCPKMLEDGEIYDAIYFDTFGEDYNQFRMFFTEYVPGLLHQHGVFSFFNGFGADRRICYDVYTRVIEMHLADAGLEVNWKSVDVDMTELAEAGKGEWEGVKRRYWTLEKYRLPVCSFLG